MELHTSGPIAKFSRQAKKAYDTYQTDGDKIRYKRKLKGIARKENAMHDRLKKLGVVLEKNDYIDVVSD